jgi:hypothetical protein
MKNSFLMPDPVTIERFTELFRGGKIAKDNINGSAGFRPWENPAGGYYPADGNVFQTAVQGHLGDPEHPIGVYPIKAPETSQGGSQSVSEEIPTYTVWWGCVDWDEGEDESYTHALNAQTVLNQCGVTSWIERSRSKGYHLWVFFTEEISAREVREGLVGACQIVNAPTREVNPKQTELTGKGVGNGVRLPYPAGAREGRNVAIKDDEELPLVEFTELAHNSRISPTKWAKVHTLYRPTSTFNPTTASIFQSASPSVLSGIAATIRRNGPRKTSEKPHGDRSATLFALGCAMHRQGFRQADIMAEVSQADKDWGGKYNKRPDGQQRLWTMVELCVERAWDNDY